MLLKCTCYSIYSDSSLGAANKSQKTLHTHFIFFFGCYNQDRYKLHTYMYKLVQTNTNTINGQLTASYINLQTGLVNITSLIKVVKSCQIQCLFVNSQDDHLCWPGQDKLLSCWLTPGERFTKHLVSDFHWQICFLPIRCKDFSRLKKLVSESRIPVRWKKSKV